MPIYEYRCKACGRITEKLARSSEKQIPCPECCGTAERMVSRCSGTVVSSTNPGGCLPSSGFG